MRHFIPPQQTHASPNTTQKVKGTCVTLQFPFVFSFFLVNLGSFILDSRIGGTHNSTPFQPDYYSWQWHLINIATWMINRNSDDQTSTPTSIHRSTNTNHLCSVHPLPPSTLMARRERQRDRDRERKRDDCRHSSCGGRDRGEEHE